MKTIPSVIHKKDGKGHRLGGDKHVITWKCLMLDIYTPSMKAANDFVEKVTLKCLFNVMPTTDVCF